MPTNVRRATKQDTAEIAEIIEEVMSEPNPVGFDHTMPAAEVAEWIDRQGEYGAMWVVVDAREQVLAFGSIDFDSSRPLECMFGSWVRQRNRRQGHGTTLAEVAFGFAREHGYQRIRGRLPQDNEPALSFLSNIGALVPLTNPGTTFELPIYEEHE